MNEFFDMLVTLPWLFVGLSAVLGLLIGSFLNVVIHRVPIMMDHELRAECAALAFQEGKGADGGRGDSKGLHGTGSAGNE